MEDNYDISNLCACLCRLMQSVTMVNSRLVVEWVHSSDLPGVSGGCWTVSGTGQGHCGTHHKKRCHLTQTKCTPV